MKMRKANKFLGKTKKKKEKTKFTTKRKREKKEGRTR